MSEEAIIIAANTEMRDHGNVEKHKEHADLFGKVFWNLFPPGNNKISWKHPGIKKGYFYISGTGKIQYTFLIEKAGTVSEFKKSNLWKDFIPEWRKEQWNVSGYDYNFALLIKNIRKIHKIPLCEFKLINPSKSVERVQNYVIVHDKQIREEVA